VSTSAEHHLPGPAGAWSPSRRAAVVPSRRCAVTWR